MAQVTNTKTPTRKQLQKIRRREECEQARQKAETKKASGILTSCAQKKADKALALRLQAMYAEEEVLHQSAIASDEALARELQEGRDAPSPFLLDPTSEDETLARLLQEECDAPAPDVDLSSIQLPEMTFRCPHCGYGIEIKEIACGVFICGATSKGQVPQHNEALAQRLKDQGELKHGCGRQFKYVDGALIPCTGQ